MHLVNDGNDAETQFQMLWLPLLPSDSTRRNQTPLHWSSEKGLLRICELLLQNGAHVNAKNNG